MINPYKLNLAYRCKKEEEVQGTITRRHIYLNCYRLGRCNTEQGIQNTNFYLQKVWGSTHYFLYETSHQRGVVQGFPLCHTSKFKSHTRFHIRSISSYEISHVAKNCFHYEGHKFRIQTPTNSIQNVLESSR